MLGDRSGSRDLRWLVRSYIRALAIVALLLTLGQIYIQSELSRQEISLRRIEAVQDEFFLTYHLDSSVADLERFEAGMKSLFVTFSDDLEAQGILQRAVPQVTVLRDGVRLGKNGETERQAAEILRHTLDVVIIHLSQQGQQHLRVLRYVECLIVCLIFAVLGMEAMLIFRPAASHVQDMFFEVESSRQLLGKRLQILHDSHEHIKADLKAAAEVQRSLLPREMPEIPGWEFAWSYKASHDVAGDMFNLIRLDETHVAIYVLDVSGHGVPAALLSVSLSRAITANVGSLLKRRIPEAPFYQLVRPAEVAQELNRRFQVMTESDQFFTLLYGVIDCENLTMEFVQAGHPGPILVTGDDVQVWEDAPDPPIGILPDLEFSQQKVQLSPGDLVLLYTDGVLEAHDPADELFGLDGITGALRKSKSSGIEICLENVYSEMVRFTQGRAQKDDLTMLGFRIKNDDKPDGAQAFGTGEVTKSGRYRSFQVGPTGSN